MGIAIFEGIGESEEPLNRSQREESGTENPSLRVPSVSRVDSGEEASCTSKEFLCDSEARKRKRLVLLHEDCFDLASLPVMRIAIFSVICVHPCILVSLQPL